MSDTQKHIFNVPLVPFSIPMDPKFSIRQCYTAPGKGHSISVDISKPISSFESI